MQKQSESVETVPFILQPVSYCRIISTVAKKKAKTSWATEVAFATVSNQSEAGAGTLWERRGCDDCGSAANDAHTPCAADS